MSAPLSLFGRLGASSTSEVRAVIVSAATEGAGATTVAALLAIASAADARRTLLVGPPDDERVRATFIGDDAGPLGIRLASLADGDRRAALRRLAPAMRDHDLVVIDAGSRLDTVVAATAALEAWHVVVTAGVDPASLAAAYAMVKAIDERAHPMTIELLLNRQEPARGADACRAVQSAAGRFLGRDLRYAGTIPDDEELRAANLAALPLPFVADRLRAGQAGLHFASRLIAEITTKALATHAARQHSWRD
ncbi:MAG: hypothetical protein HYR75_01465 [Gemmatimonadetes bacterium]|nr:hypothetical protein [Gemmatimonadota bacterium]MBI3568668.1 hypothetical protein [Gemmatimonadota bacterium]